MWDWVVLANSFLFLVYILHSWFSNIVEEAFFNGHHTKKVEISLKLGMGLFIVSEVMFFFSIFWAFFHSSVSPAISIGAVWPPVGIEPISAFGVPFLNTVILLFSGLTLTLSHRMFVLIAGHSTPSIPAV